MSTRRRAGFTLLEILVALGVFSLAALALLKLSGQNVQSAEIAASRTYAGIVAHNLAVEAQIATLALGEQSGEEQLAGRRWRWRRVTAATADPAILRVDITVQAEGGAQTLASLRLFRGRT
jgi:general secretion pathway protein I